MFAVPWPPAVQLQENLEALPRTEAVVIGLIRPITRLERSGNLNNLFHRALGPPENGERHMQGRI